MPYEFLQEEIPQQQPKPSGRNILHNLGGLAARGAEAILGVPGDVLHGAKSVGDFLGSLIPEPPISLPKTQSPLLIGAKKVAQKVSPSFAENIPTSIEDVPSSLTTQNLRKDTQHLTGEAFEPEGELEKNAQEFTTTFAPLLLGNPTKILSKIPSAAKIAGAGQLAKWASQDLPIPEWGKEALKTGAMLVTSYLGQPNAEKYAKNLYKTVEKNISPESSVPFNKIIPDIRKIRDTIERSAIPKKDVILQNIEAIENSAFQNRGKIPSHELWNLNKTVNEWLRRGEIVHTSQAKKVLGDISHHLNKNLIEANPHIAQDLTNANQIWRSLKATEDISPIMSSTLEALKNSVGPATLGFLAHMFLPSGGLKNLVLGAGVAYKGIKLGREFIHNIINNPGLRRYYFDISKAALNENRPQLINQVKKFDMFLKNHPDIMQSLKGQEQTKWEFVD
jgi:hypothetical protein